MNNKLTEFIIKHSAFYNCLSDENKIFISDLDVYYDLDILEMQVNKEDVYNSYVYLYIGDKDNKYCIIRCKNYYNKFKVSEEKVFFISKDSVNIERRYE